MYKIPVHYLKQRGRPTLLRKLLMSTNVEMLMLRNLNLNITKILRTPDIIADEEISIYQCTVTVWAFPLLIQSWRKGHVGLEKRIATPVWAFFFFLSFRSSWETSVPPVGMDSLNIELYCHAMGNRKSVRRLDTKRLDTLNWSLTLTELTHLFVCDGFLHQWLQLISNECTIGI